MRRFSLPDSDPTRLLTPFVKQGEALRWTGRPRFLKTRLHTHLAALITGIGAGGAVHQAFSDSDALLLSVSVGVSLMPLAIVYGLFLLLTELRRRFTAYGLTATTAIIHSAFPMPKTTLIDLERVSDIRVELGRGDLGTVWFGPKQGNVHLSLPAFENIRHARHVFDIARCNAPSDQSESA